MPVSTLPVLLLANPITDLVNAAATWGAVIWGAMVLLAVLHIVLVIYIFSDYEKRGGGGCGGCFWAIFVLHFGFIGLLCYLMVRPSLRPEHQPVQIITNQQFPMNQPQSTSPAPPAAEQNIIRHPPVPEQRALQPAPQPVIQAAPALMCPNCRAPLEAGDQFCQSCGASLGGAPAALSQPNQRVLSIGRGYDCDLQYDMPQISTRHALLHVTAQGTFIEDQGSANGTYVNGNRIFSRTQINSADMLGFGSYTISCAELFKRVGV